MIYPIKCVERDVSSRINKSCFSYIPLERLCMVLTSTETTKPAWYPNFASQHQKAKLSAKAKNVLFFWYAEWVICAYIHKEPRNKSSLWIQTTCLSLARNIARYPPSSTLQQRYGRLRVSVCSLFEQKKRFQSYRVYSGYMKRHIVERNFACNSVFFGHKKFINWFI